MTVQDDRSIAFERWWNVRDLGDLPVAGGGATRSGVIYRASSPEYATAVDIENARRLGFTSFVDLRSASDRTDWRDEAPGIRVVNVDLKGRLPSTTAESEGDLLRLLLDANRGKVVEAIRTITDLADEAPPVVLHCYSGKDRTGLIAMVLLSLVPVPNAAILDDYMSSNPAFAAMSNTMASEVGEQFMADAPAAFRGPVVRSGAEKALRFLEDSGGVRSYLRSGGLDGSDIERASRLLR